MDKAMYDGGLPLEEYAHERPLEVRAPGAGGHARGRARGDGRPRRMHGTTSSCGGSSPGRSPAVGHVQHLRRLGHVPLGHLVSRVNGFTRTGTLARNVAAFEGRRHGGVQGPLAEGDPVWRKCGRGRVESAVRTGEGRQRERYAPVGGGRGRSGCACPRRPRGHGRDPDRAGGRLRRLGARRRHRLRLPRSGQAHRRLLHLVPHGLQEPQGVHVLVVPRARPGHVDHVGHQRRLRRHVPPAEPRVVYDKEFAHGTKPHLGSLPQCLGCHAPSDGIAEPGVSPHHNGGSPGMSPCSSCHKQKQHVGTVDCEACHTTANAYHTYQAKSPGFRKCAGCHTMRHAGRRVSGGKCATCHRGTGTGAQKLAQHSTNVTKRLTCNLSGCHNKALHAAPAGSGSPVAHATAESSMPPACPSPATPPASGVTARPPGTPTATRAVSATATLSMPASPTPARSADNT